MRNHLLVFLLVLLHSALPAREWMGVRRPLPKAPPALPDNNADSAPESAVSAVRGRTADTAWISRTVRQIPVGAAGEYLGDLEGVRCFHCTPDAVLLNLSDTLTRSAGTLTLRTGIWNAIERPVRDRRVFDHANQCVFFGYRAVDTVFVGGEPTEIRLHDVPCYPYLQRTARRETHPAPDTLEAPSPIQAQQSEPE